MAASYQSQRHRATGAGARVERDRDREDEGEEREDEGDVEPAARTRPLYTFWALGEAMRRGGVKTRSESPTGMRDAVSCVF